MLVNIKIVQDHVDNTYWRIGSRGRIIKNGDKKMVYWMYYEKPDTTYALGILVGRNLSYVKECGWKTIKTIQVPYLRLLEMYQAKREYIPNYLLDFMDTWIKHISAKFIQNKFKNRYLSSRLSKCGLSKLRCLNEIYYVPKYGMIYQDCRESFEKNGINIKR